MKRAIPGIVVNVLAIVAACFGLMQYFTNAGTTYFKGLGTNPAVISTVAAAAVLACLAAFFNVKKEA